jgi:ParB-like chromosome segregation protein Spo0J
MAKKKIAAKIFISKHPDQLKAHPLQGKAVHDLDPGQFELLKDNIRRNGITDRLEITPDGVIIDGHQRWRAAKELGIKNVRCRVHRDLKTTEEVKQRFLEVNLVRRQMSRLAQARVLRQLYPEGDERFDVARQLFENVSDVTLKRWDALLDVPLEVQKAVEADKVKLVDAVRVKHQTAKTQKIIAKLISEGQNPKEVIKKHTRKQRQPSKQTVLKKATKSFFDGLKSGVEGLAGDQKNVRDGLTQEHVAILEKAQQFIAELLEANTDGGDLEYT